MRDDGAQWFAARRGGVGPGLPISWQGWALAIIYVGLTILIAATAGERPLLLLALLVSITGTFHVIAVRTTKGRQCWH